MVFVSAEMAYVTESNRTQVTGEIWTNKWRRREIVCLDVDVVLL
uniref:Uncharacterized protein n=1 Tax=Setaria viridis TaxID=4556 RepID=A0A4U6UIP7_SETVI|nr:hypothetical protein SEVIR_5G228750v2 [Setaria viridis]